MILCIKTLNSVFRNLIYTECAIRAECLYANVIMLSVFMLNVIMLSVFMLNVIIGTVVVKFRDSQMFDHFDKFVDRLVISLIFAKVSNFRKSLGDT
jgi:hypothetical protein